MADESVFQILERVLEVRAEPMLSGYRPKGIEECFECGTHTPAGCMLSCRECVAGSAYIPLEATYHCPACGRWWAYILPPRITVITYGVPKDATSN